MKRPRFRYSLSTLLLLVLGASVALGWLKMKHDQQMAANRIEWLYGDVFYDYHFDQNGRLHRRAQPPDASWLRRLGDAWVSEVKSVSLRDPYMRVTSPSKMAQWSGKGEGVTDSTLALVVKFPSLEQLYVSSNDVSNHGLNHLRNLRALRFLTVASTNVTDVGLEHIAEIKTLEAIDLSRTRVSASGIDRLQRSLPGCAIVTRDG